MFVSLLYYVCFQTHAHLRGDMCGFDKNEPNHCCNKTDISKDKFCDLNEVLNEVSSPWYIVLWVSQEGKHTRM